MKKLLSLIRIWSPNYIERTKEFFVDNLHNLSHTKSIKRRLYIGTIGIRIGRWVAGKCKYGIAAVI